MPSPGPAALVLAVLIALALTAARLHASSPRRRRLNEALHELRRPLQGLALLLDGDSAPAGGVELVEQAAHALAELDGRINGVAPSCEQAPTALSDLAAEARRRWGGRLEVEGPPAAHEARVAADRRHLASALDNLIANALEHGSGPVRLRARAEGATVRLDVASRGEPRAARDGSDPRRGHGLRVVERVAAEHGGTALPPRAESGHTTAGICLPRADGAGGGWPRA
jgi:signal transduction histidine kinase